MKKNSQKKTNPFKVNQIRSMKIKAKAQPFKGQLKHLKDIVNKKVSTADEDLKALGEIIRQTPKPTHQEIVMSKDSSENSKLIENYQTMERNAEDALKKLEAWSCEK